MGCLSIIRIIKRAFVLLCIILPSLAFSREYGINVYFSTLSIDDQEGPTENVSQFSPLNFYYADKLSFDTRYWTEIFYDSANLAAGGDNIGQGVSIYGFSGAWQKRFRFTNEIKPWAGVGLSYTKLAITARHTMDSDGFLEQRFSDLQNNNFDLYFVASNHWKLNQQWDIGAVSRFVPPLVGDVLLFSVGISASYH